MYFICELNDILIENIAKYVVQEDALVPTTQDLVVRVHTVVDSAEGYQENHN
jgi:hypothetical protein